MTSAEQEAMNESTQPYCEHPECHDSMTKFYRRADWWTATTSSSALPSPSQWVRAVEIHWWPFPGSRRLCAIHARHEYGIAMGGRL